jgi:hypothetical protein
MSNYNFAVPALQETNSRKSRIPLGIVDAIIVFRAATRCGLREAKWIVENNLSRDEDGNFSGQDLGHMISAWYGNNVKEKYDE